jgi:hypothetical protein
VRRLAPALLILPLVAAGCREAIETFPCPGSAIATFDFTGTRSQVTCAAGAPAAGVNALYPATVAFTGTLTATASGAGAALCLDHARAEPLLGTLATDQVDVALQTRGALLAGCSATCAVTTHQQVTGAVLRGAGGAPSGFSGTLLDQATLDATVTGASCSPCTTPCQATYLLSGLPR